MPAGGQKQTAYERRKGESVGVAIVAALLSFSLTRSLQALSEFADYVDKQQAKGKARESSAAPSDSGYSTQSTQYEEHAELDILDSLNLAETTQVRLKDLLLDLSEDAEVTLQQLSDVLQKRMLEGHGETLFDLGQQDNGESMAFSREQWDVALDRIRRAASILQAECRVLMTRNVGGAEEVETPNDRDKSCTGKVVIRQSPETPEDVIETRIAVVGNGNEVISRHSTHADASSAVDAGKSTMLGVLVKGGLDDGRGKARVNLFRHKHEVESGRTSSVGMEIMGFDTHGDIVASNVPGRKLSWEEIGKRSVRPTDQL